jgi:hypothetical protein
MNCKLLVFNNFYENPDEVREFALKADYNSCHLPRFHTKSYATVNLLNKIENLLYPFAGKIHDFYIPNINSSGDTYNGSFQYGTSHKKPWIHVDATHKTSTVSCWAGVIYLTPNPPVNTGTNLYKHKNFNDDKGKYDDSIIMEDRLDKEKWELYTKVENIYNRAIFYKVNQYHSADNYFGKELNNSRLFQIFFFSTDF